MPPASATVSARHDLDPERPAGAPESGKWRAARTTPAAASVQDAKALLATPYLQGYRPAGDRSSVTVYDRARAQPGLNLYVSGHAPEAFLIDMTGRVVHRWRCDLGRAWPELARGADAEAMRRVDYWRRAMLLPDGSLVAIFEGVGAVRVDRDSHLLWAYRGGTHHDLFRGPDDTVWLLDRRSIRRPDLRPDGNVLEDLVTVLGAEDGRVRRQISILSALERSRWAPLLKTPATDPDLLHTNTLEMVTENPLRRRIAAFRPGALLLSILKLDLLAVLDPQRDALTWGALGPWRRQHQPTLLPGGNLLLFDNLGLGDRSRVLELDPANGQVLWSYPSRPAPELLLSRTLGSEQRLANGDTMITESENGHAIEVTPGGDVVWEFWSPHRAGPHHELGGDPVRGAAAARGPRLAAG